MVKKLLYFLILLILPFYFIHPIRWTIPLIGWVDVFFMVFFYFVIKKIPYGILYAIFVGIFMDIFVAPYLGFYVVVEAFLYFLIYFSNKLKLFSSPLATFLMSIGILLAQSLFSGIYLLLFRGHFVFDVSHSIATGIVTGFILFLIYDRIFDTRSLYLER